jgi:acetyltransferase-like isoleucine patch superfamily enzyme
MSIKSNFSYFYVGLWNHILNKIPIYSLRRIILKYCYRMDVGDSTIHYNVKFFAPWNVRIGDGSNIQMNSFIDGRGGVDIGNNVDITMGVTILSMSHNIDDPWYSSIIRNVEIGDNSVIFTNSTILPGVSIGSGCCVGAGSVVSKSTGGYSLYAGNPAIFIRSRNSEILYQVKYKRFFH